MDDSVELNMDFSLLTAHSTMLMAHSSQFTAHEIGFPEAYFVFSSVDKISWKKVTYKRNFEGTFYWRHVLLPPHYQM